MTPRGDLSTVVLRNIVDTLGFDDSFYETKEKLLDERSIQEAAIVFAHGDFVELSEREILELQDECMSLMVIFRNQIDNAVSLQLYKSK